MRKIKYLLVMLFVSFISLTNAKGLYDNYDYYIDDYNVVIDVNKDNSFDITEEIRVYFNQARHGIYRSIPLRNRVSRLDGTTTNNYVNVSNVYTNVFSTQSKSDGNLVIRLGDANNLVTGYQEYVIKYNYNIGKDSLKDKDEFYFNIIGPEWETVITNVTFTINMPEEFDESLLGFSNGPESFSTNSVSYEVSGNTITGSLNTPLYEGDALTVRLELPEGYFSEAKSNYGINNVIAIIIPIISVIIAGLILYIKKRSVRIVDTIEFYPPDDYNSLEIAFLYKGSVTNKDVISLLVYLADKKYLKIEEVTTKSLNTDYTTTQIIKLKDYDGNKHEEYLFMESLFKNGNKIMVEDIADELYTAVYDIKNKMNSPTNKQQLFLSSNKTYKFLYILCAFLSISITNILIFINYYSSEALIGNIITILFFAVVIVLVLKTKYTVATKIVISIFIVAFAIMFFVVTNYQYMYGTLSIISSIISVICSVIIIYWAFSFNFKTDFGNKIYGRILGFKKFLETAEKEQLEALVDKNPEYFYDILPYTYVLGVSDKWIKNFEGIALSAPSWYSGSGAFDIITFNNYISTTTSSVVSSVTYDSSSSSSSGGGISGGGSGGGGGGSW